MVSWPIGSSSCLPLRQGFLLPRSLLLVTPSLQISTISQHFGQPNRMTFLNQQICGLQNSMQSFSSLSYCEMQTNANEMKPTIVPPSYPPSLANLLLGLWVTCSVYANFTTLIKTGSLAKLVLLTWMHLRIAHQTQSTQPGLSHKDVHKSFQSVMERSV